MHFKLNPFLSKLTRFSKFAHKSGFNRLVKKKVHSPYPGLQLYYVPTNSTQTYSESTSKF